jgi:hypothetical protein
MVLLRNKSKLSLDSFPCNTNLFDIQPPIIPEGMIENQKEKFEVECDLIKQPIENVNQENKSNYHEFDQVNIYQAESTWEEFEFF